MLRALALCVLAVSPVAASCPAARGPPLGEYDTLASALKASSAPRRIRTAFVNEGGYTLVRALGNDDTASWRIAISDGKGEFFALGPEQPEANIPPGRYGVTIDALRAPPFVYGAEWDACASDVEPEPPCPLGPFAEPWGRRMTGAAPTVDFELRAANAQAADVTAVVVNVTRETTVEVLAGHERVGWAASDGEGQVTVEFEKTLRVLSTEPLRVHVRSHPTAIAVDAETESPPDGTGAAFAFRESGPRFVGSVVSSTRSCPGVAVSSKFLLTTTRSAIKTVEGWDPDTVRVAQISVFMTPSSDPDVVIKETMGDLLTLIDSEKPTGLIRITNLVGNFVADSRPTLQNCIAEVLCPVGTTSACLDPVFRDRLEARKRITFNFADIDMYSKNIQPFTGDLWIGIETQLGLSGIAETIKSTLLNGCSSIFRVPPGVDPNDVQASAESGEGLAAAPTKVVVNIYASPNSNRNLFRDYATYVVFSNRQLFQKLDKNTPRGYISFGDFEPIYDEVVEADPYSWSYAYWLFGTSGILLFLMLILSEAFTTRWSKAFS